MTLAEKIIELRTTNNMSQGDLAEKLNVSRQSVSKWETGASIPDLNKLILMSELFQVTIDELVKDKHEPNHEKDCETENNYTSNYSINATLGYSPQNTSVRIVGYILLAGAFLLVLIGSLTHFSLIIALLLACYIALCGLICIFSKKHAGRRILIITLIILVLILFFYWINMPVVHMGIKVE